MKKVVIQLIISTIAITHLYCIDTSSNLYTHFCVTRPIKADISMLIADLKYKDGEIKICELGNGMNSRFKGYDALYGRGKMWSCLWDYVRDLTMPVWYVGPDFIDLVDPQEAVLKNPTPVPVNYAEDLTSLQVISKQTNPTLLNDIKKYDGLVMFRHRDPAFAGIQAFRREHPSYLVLDNVISPFVNNKYVTNWLFNKLGLQAYKPKFLLCKKKYTPQLAKEIINQLQTQTYVIKPLAACKGRGVIIVDKQDLDTTLKTVLHVKNLPDGNKDLERTFNYKDETFSYWRRDTLQHFLVEEYCPSKTIMFNGKNYDPTVRLVCLLAYTNNNVSVRYVDAYWKFPVVSLDDKQGSTTERHKSLGTIAIKLSDEDQKIVTHLFDEFILNMYQKMINMLNGVD